MSPEALYFIYNMRKEGGMKHNTSKSVELVDRGVSIAWPRFSQLQGTGRRVGG